VRKLLPIAAILVLLDQIAKFAVRGFDLFGFHHQGMMPYESRPFLGDILRWTYVENPGMAFGLNFGMPVILSLFSLVAAIFLVYLLKRTERDGMSGLRIALTLILAGAVGNLIDRMFYGLIFGYGPLFYGKVVDFIDVDIPDINILGLHLSRFYVFNIADAAVSVGVLLLLIFYPAHKQVPEPPQPPPEGPEETPVAPTPPGEGTYVETVRIRP
jgi:signal peptidase II